MNDVQVISLPEQTWIPTNDVLLKKFLTTLVKHWIYFLTLAVEPILWEDSHPKYARPVIESTRGYVFLFIMNSLRLNVDYVNKAWMASAQRLRGKAVWSLPVLPYTFSSTLSYFDMSMYFTTYWNVNIRRNSTHDEKVNIHPYNHSIGKAA